MKYGHFGDFGTLITFERNNDLSLNFQRVFVYAMASSSKNLVTIGAFVTELRRPKKTGFLIFLYCVLSRPGLVGAGGGGGGGGGLPCGLARPLMTEWQEKQGI